MRHGQPWKPPCNFLLKAAILAVFCARSIEIALRTKKPPIWWLLAKKLPVSALLGENTNLDAFDYEFTC